MPSSGGGRWADVGVGGGPGRCGEGAEGRKARAGCPFAGLKSSILVLSVVHYARGVHSLWLKFYSRLCRCEYSVIRWRNSISGYFAILSTGMHVEEI